MEKSDAGSWRRNGPCVHGVPDFPLHHRGAHAPWQDGAEKRRSPRPFPHPHRRGQEAVPCGSRGLAPAVREAERRPGVPGPDPLRGVRPHHDGAERVQKLHRRLHLLCGPHSHGARRVVDASLRGIPDPRRVPGRGSDGIRSVRRVRIQNPAGDRHGADIGRAVASPPAGRRGEAHTGRPRPRGRAGDARSDHGQVLTRGGHDGHGNHGQHHVQQPRRRVRRIRDHAGRHHDPPAADGVQPAAVAGCTTGRRRM